jgi:glycosyltransferase involved in cell wall biosynthesis
MDWAISVIIPTYNRREMVQRALHSVLKQTHTAAEIIVVDDGSTDGTAEALPPAPNLKILTVGHGGVSAARNAGVAASSLPWIAFLDADDEWNPDKLEKQTRWLEQNPGNRICQTQEIWIRNGKRVNPGAVHRKQGGLIFPLCLERCMVTPSSVLLERKLFDQCGGFDAAMPACEDYDLWLRLAVREPVGLVDEMLLTRYAGHPDQLSATVEGQDKYRIAALVKILRSGILSGEHRSLTLGVLAKKCRIYGAGCLKRGRNEEGERILALPEIISAGSPGRSF